MEVWSKTKYANYIVSNYGRVFNTKTKRIVGTKGNNGYIKVSISDKVYGNRSIEAHRIVAETLVPGYQPGLVVDHIDGNKTNNHVSNLRWVTVSFNVTGTHGGKQKKRLTKEQKAEAKTLYKNGMSLIRITLYMNQKYNRNSSRATYTRAVRK